MNFLGRGFTDNFLAKMGFIPRNGAADGYPFDLDASTRHVRLATGNDYWPTHSNKDNFAKLGLVNGNLRQFDSRVWAQGWGAAPMGPIVSNLPENLQWQMMIPGLTKQLPQSN